MLGGPRVDDELRGYIRGLAVTKMTWGSVDTGEYASIDRSEETNEFMKEQGFEVRDWLFRSSVVFFYSFCFIVAGIDYFTDVPFVWFILLSFLGLSVDD
ncbi:hypothetical protein PsorP6_016187 [Peronosclerospora sorghi]|uniref:Uncharacterized protein n=1 Tax=Peronosclerospora sorghi TaxID=230839 RepID=A0ACC0VPA9_9STRA|nr:hypothetical protein PsorP6_016187 [Peronosclerospora sorghi]